MGTKVYRYNLKKLIHFIEHKRVSVPEFQRGYVWKIAQVKSLFDSLVKKYPIGSFIIWETKQKIDARTINGEKLPPEKLLILDGQQRILSLYYLCRQKIFSQYNVRENFHQITEAKHNQLIDFERFYIEKINGNYILEYGRDRNEEFNFKKFQDILGNSYNFPVVIVSLDNYRKAIEVFERINQAGTRIATESIFLSETWSRHCDFEKLLRKWKRNNSESLSRGIDTVIFIHVFALIFQLEKFDKKLKRSNIEVSVKILKKIAEIVREESSEKYNNIFKNVIEAIADSVSYLIQEYDIKNLSDLPSQTMLTVLSVYFYYQRRHPSSIFQQRELRKWFWRSSLFNRYIGSGYNRNIGSDALGMKNLSQSQKRLYIPFKDIYFSDFSSVELKAGRSTLRNIIKQALWQQTPVFIDELKIMRRNQGQKLKNPEDDHFFPFNLYRKNILNYEVNNIFNIHFLEGSENVRKGKKMPSEWLGERIQKIKPSQKLIEKYFKSQLLPFKTFKELKNFDRIFEKSKGKKKKDMIYRRYKRFLYKRFKLFKIALNRMQKGKKS